MVKGMIVALAIVGLVLSVGLANAQQKSEGLMGKVKNIGTETKKGSESLWKKTKEIIPGGSKEKAGAEKEEGESLWQKTKEMLPGGKEKAGAQKKEGESLWQKTKDIIPGGKK